MPQLLEVQDFTVSGGGFGAGVVHHLFWRR